MMSIRFNQHHGDRGMWHAYAYTDRPQRERVWVGCSEDRQKAKALVKHYNDLQREKREKRNNEVQQLQKGN